MPYEVSMSGGQPWGFRLSQGSHGGMTCVISRITPGGKAAQANVMQGDVLVAVNGTAISDLPLTDVMKSIKSSGDEVHLTLLTQEEIEASLKHKRQSEINFTTATEVERPASNIPPHSPSCVTPVQGHTPIPQDVPDSFLQPQVQTQRLSAPPSPVVPSPVEQPTPKPRSSSRPTEVKIEEAPVPEMEPVQQKKDYPDYVKRHLKPQKPLPEFKPQVNWLHGKLKINMKQNPNALSDPGNKLKTAAQAHPNQPIEIEGPLSATVVHAQYNTPVGLYSGTQIVNTLIGTAAAKGAKVTEPDMLGSDDTAVNKDTPVYKLVHNRERASPAPTQSRSIQILDALLSQPGATLPSAF